MTITKGFWRTDIESKAEVVDVRNGIAIGWVGECPESWLINGKSNSISHFDLIEPWVDAPKLRPWTIEEVPLGAWLRDKDRKSRWVITNTTSETRRQEWLELHEHSIDGGKTWKPCGVEVKP